MYQADAMKEYDPSITVKKCMDLFEEYGFISHDIIRYQIVDMKQLGCYKSSLLQKPSILYQLHPEKFPYLKDAEKFWFGKVSGKGLHQTQCEASLFMEYFERLSIELKIYETAAETSKIKMNYTEYRDYLRKNFPEQAEDYLEVFREHQDESFTMVTAEDIISGKNILIPKFLLFYGSNGYASGNTDHESISHAVFEIVERYAQTLWIIKSMNSSREDLEIRSRSNLLSFSPELFDHIGRIDPKIINLDSIIKAFPDLEEAIHKNRQFFDVFEIIDLSITINGTRFYNYIARSGEETTGYKMFAGSGCHFDQRIALIRTLTECAQGYVEGEKLNQAWNGFLFNRYFINQCFHKHYDTADLVPDNRRFSSIEELYQETIKPFSSIAVFTCTNEHFKIPVHSVYIPDLYSKSFIWSYLYCTSSLQEKLNYPTLEGAQTVYGDGILIEKDFTGLEYLFFGDNIKSISSSRWFEFYDEFLSRMGDLSLLEYLIKEEKDADYQKRLLAVKEKTGKPVIATIYSADRIDPQSFLHFHNLVTKKDPDDEDMEIIFDRYASSGFLDYAIHFMKEREIDPSDAVEPYLDRYYELEQILSQGNQFHRLLHLKEKLYRITGDGGYQKGVERLQTIIGEYNGLLAPIWTKDLTAFGTLKAGYELEGFTLKLLYEDNYSLYFFFSDTKEELEVKVSLIDDHKPYHKIKNQYFIHYKSYETTAAQKKFLKSLIRLIEDYIKSL